MQQHGVVIDMRDCYTHSSPAEVDVVEDVLADDFLVEGAEVFNETPRVDFLCVAAPVVPVLLLPVVEGDDECNVLSRGEADAGDLVLDGFYVDG